MWYWMHDARLGWGGWLLMGLVMVIFWALVIVGVIYLVRWLLGDRRCLSNGGDRWAGDSAMDILKKRYARGEITKEEFEAIKKDLL